MLALQDVGYAVLVPFGENTRYDLVIDDGRVLTRVQCKTGRLRSGAVVFNTCSAYAHHPNPRMVRRDYAGDIDFFAVYCRDNDSVYLIPIEDVPTVRQARLRVSPARNGQARFVRLAQPYEIARVSVV